MQFNKSYTPSVASTTFWNAATITGDGPWTPTTTSTTDSLAHATTMTVATSNFSDRTFLFTGTDADGNAQTESIAGPNNNTITLTKLFRTITSVSKTAGAALATNNVSLGITAVCCSQSIGLEKYSVAPAAVAVDISGTINFDIEETPEDFYNTPQQNGFWANNGNFTAQTADKGGVVSQSMRCLRLYINSHSGSATARVSVAHAVR